MQFDLRLVSSVEKCFLDEELSVHPEYTAARALRGERFSFQLAWRGTDPGLNAKHVFFARVESPLADAVKLSEVESVAVRFPVYKVSHDADYLRTEPGLYPDLLMPVTEKTQLYCVYNDTRCLWVDVEVPEKCKPGAYPVTIVFVLANGEEAARRTFTLTVVDRVLPPQTLAHTCWFHCDCLAQYYRVPVWSPEHWRITENFVRTAVKNGVNMILTPVFTPPLDTAVGGERLTTQLVDVTRTAGKWSFSFARLGKWIDMCERCGVKWYEISHLFTQWGAKHAPKVIASVDGVEQRVFGWDTDSLGEEYTGFLRAFLPRLVAYLKRRGIADRCVFHVSDEPSLEALEQYRAVRAVIEPYLKGFPIMDALSKYEFYSTGALDHPIPSTNHIEPFLENKVPHLWTYYCCGQVVDVSNRLLSMPGQRTRILGVQLWKYNIEGFLQWGYNFWNSQYSVRPIDPYLVSDGEYFVPAGDAFVVYPAPDGTAYETLHFRHFSEGLTDMRVLQLAESVLSREAVEEIVEGGLDEKITFKVYPRDASYVLDLHEKLLAALESAPKKRGGKKK